MKKIITLALVLFLNTISAQVNIDFNTQPFPSDWTMQGGFEISNAEIHPRCQQNALIGSIFEQESMFWIQTASYDYNGGNIEINLTHGIKDLYHALGVSNPFQKPELFLEYAEGDSENWIEHEEISLDNINESTTCLSYTSIINASDTSGFETVKYRFVYKSPAQTGMIYLLYWSIDSIQITEQESIAAPCTDNLGGGLEPSFITVKINDTSFDHNTYDEPTEYYHEYPATSNTTATLVAGQSYDIYTFTSSEAIIGIWIDYNQNDEFEANEFTELVNNMNAQNTTSFTIPTDIVGDFKMRIRSRAYGSSILSTDACTNFGSGETRDYTITVIESPLSVNDFDLLEVKAYPNPVKDILNISSEQEISGIEIFNLLGQRIVDKKINTNTTSIDLSVFPQGNYILKIKSGNNQKTLKVVKQ